MLHEKALKVFGKPNLGSRRIFNDEKSAMFNLIKSDSCTKFYHGKILFPFLISISRIINILHLTPWSTNRCHVDDFWLLSLNDFHCLSPAFGSEQVVTCAEVYWSADSKSLHCCRLTKLGRAAKQLKEI